jgi:hypothetical protein
MKKPEINDVPAEVVAYIEYLEGCLNGSSELILALNTASKVLADDLNMICEGEDLYYMDVVGAKSKLTLLSGDAKDKTFERIMVLFDKFDKIKALSQHFKGSIAPEKEKKSTAVKLKPGGNIYEHMVSKVKNGSAGI